MKFLLMSQLEIAYLRDGKGDVVRKYYAPKGQFFYPGAWEFEQFPKDFFLKTMSFGDFVEIINEIDK